jgi:hypothetical protein
MSEKEPQAEKRIIHRNHGEDINQFAERVAVRTADGPVRAIFGSETMELKQGTTADEIVEIFNNAADTRDPL